jgi:hypothetical protein
MRKEGKNFVNKLEFGGHDGDGPNMDNRFIPSIEVHESQTGKIICVGFQYNGRESSLDPGAYSFDHAIVRKGFNDDEGKQISKEDLEKRLKGSDFSIEQLKEEFTRRLRK